MTAREFVKSRYPYAIVHKTSYGFWEIIDNRGVTLSYIMSRNATPEEAWNSAMSKIKFHSKKINNLNQCSSV